MSPRANDPAPGGRERRRGPWRDLWRRYRGSRTGMVALWAILLLGVIAAGAPFIAGTRPIACRYLGQWYFPALHDYNPRWENPVFFKDGFRILHYPRSLAEKDPESVAIWPLFYADPSRRVEAGEWKGGPEDPGGFPPTARNPLGTDRLGQDVLARMVHGTSVALLVGLLSMGIAAVIGICVGAAAGWLGGWVDLVLCRLIDVTLSIPSVVLILALMAVLERPTIWHVMAAIGCTRWEGIARYVRGEFLRLKETEFVLAARALGAHPLRIILRHLLPNALAPVVTAVTFGIAGAILIESGLSFLWIGGDPLAPSWGRILNEGFESRNWWLIVFPGLGIFATVLIYNIAGDALQEAGNPRSRKSP